MKYLTQWKIYECPYNIVCCAVGKFVCGKLIMSCYVHPLKYNRHITMYVTYFRGNNVRKKNKSSVLAIMTIL